MLSLEQLDIIRKQESIKDTWAPSKDLRSPWAHHHTETKTSQVCRSDHQLIGNTGADTTGL